MRFSGRVVSSGIASFIQGFTRLLRGFVLVGESGTTRTKPANTSPAVSTLLELRSLISTTLMREVAIAHFRQVGSRVGSI